MANRRRIFESRHEPRATRLFRLCDIPPFVTYAIGVIVATQLRGFPLSADAPRVSLLAKIS
jgi:hypothetical protein